MGQRLWLFGEMMIGRPLSGLSASFSRGSYGPVIVTSAFLVLMISSGITYSTAVVFRFVEGDLGIGRGLSAFVFASSQFVTFMVGPFAGALEERVGPRIVVGGGVALLCAGALGAATAHSYPAFLFWYIAAIGIGNGAIYVPSLGVIQRWFHKRRGLATGLSTTGVSIGTLVFPLATEAIAASEGWRMVYVWFAGISVSIGLGAALALVGAPPKESGAVDSILNQTMKPSLTPEGLTLKEALLDKQFYLLYLIGTGAALLSFIAFVHLPQDAVESTAHALSSGMVISVIGGASFLARIVFAPWADFIGRAWMLRIAFCLLVLTCLLWATAAGWQFFLVAGFFGLAYGLCISLLPTVIADYFGSREVSRIIGAIYTSFAFAALVGPTIAGLLRDQTGNYAASVKVCLAISILTLLSSLAIKNNRSNQAGENA